MTDPKPPDFDDDLMDLTLSVEALLASVEARNRSNIAADIDEIRTCLCAIEELNARPTTDRRKGKDRP